jgi:hypothetical protein
MRNYAKNPNLPRRVGDCDGRALSAAAATAAASAPANDDLPGRIPGCCRHGLPDAAATSAPAAAAPVDDALGRARLITERPA